MTSLLDARDEASLLARSSGYFNGGRHVGYLPFAAANTLVGTGRWQFTRVDFWGYIIEPRYGRGN